MRIIQAAARSLGADAVLMAWYDCHSIHSRDEDTYRADVYLVDVRTGKLYTSVKGLLDTKVRKSRISIENSVKKLFQNNRNSYYDFTK